MTMAAYNSTSKELLALQKGINRLRKSNKWLKLGLSESDFQDEDIQAYLLRPLGENTQLDIETENKVKAAVYLATRRSKWKPRSIAKKLAESSVEALRDARLMSLYESDKISAKQFNEEIENNQVSKIAVTYKRIKKRYGRKICKTALTAAISATCGGPAGLISGGVMLISEVLPKKTKEKIKKTVKRAVKRTAEAVSHGIERLCDRAPQIASRVVRKVQETVDKVTQTVSRVATPVVEAVREVGHTIKEKAKKVWKWLTS